MITKLCIPRIESVINKEYISEKVEKLNMGELVEIKEIYKKDDPYYKRIMMKMCWDETNTGNKERYDMIERLGSIKLVHTTLGYWKIVKSRYENKK
jgi:hypothetical protein